MVTLTFNEWWIENNIVQGECNCHMQEYFIDMVKSKNEEYLEAVEKYQLYLNKIKLELEN